MVEDKQKSKKGKKSIRWDVIFTLNLKVISSIKIDESINMSLISTESINMNALMELPSTTNYKSFKEMNHFQ